MKLVPVALYIAAIVAVNYMFSVIPLVEVFGEKWPPTSLAVGFIFVFRDFAQRAIGHWVLPAMLVGAALSFLMADPYVATASVIAFLVAEGVDWLVYTATKRPFGDRVLLSSAIATPIDSVAFLALLGAFSPLAVLLMTASKMAGALVVWSHARRALRPSAA